MKRQATSPANSSPTISVYQNPDHVSGILQQLFGVPLLTTERREQNADQSSGTKTETKGRVAGGLKGALPFVGSAGVDAEGDLARLRESGLASSAKTTQDFTYSQAYYLKVVRDALRDRGLLRRVGGSSDSAGLASGEFVEFEATFRPNAVNALLDILTPDLVGAIAEAWTKSDALKRFSGYGTFDEVKRFAEQSEFSARLRGDFARAVAAAVRVDFRAGKTREFYARIEDITAVTICDTSHFVVDDEDRVLDGNYTVLGKVTSSVEQDVPVLSRNKLLERLKPELVDATFAMLREAATQQSERIDLGSGGQFAPKDALDLVFPSRISGPSFKVVPIAIFV